jgi:Tfp pilus assembly protein PilP
MGLIIVILLLSCSSSSQKKINAYIAHIKQMVAIKYSKKSPPALNLNPPTPVFYQGQTSHSPFGKINSANKITDPLLVYPITMLRFVGTLFENGKIYAYLIAPDNKLYQVKVDDKIGDHGGVITRIEHDRVEIMEKVHDKGAETQHLVTLQLKDENR